MSQTALPLISMYLFLSTGQFGSIKLGDTSASLLAQLGEPDAVSQTKTRRPGPVIWKYGDIEFHLNLASDQIIQIFCDVCQGQDLMLGSRANLAAWFFKGQTAIESVEKELVMADLSFQRLLPSHPTMPALVRLANGVELLFYQPEHPDNSDSDYFLRGFQYTDPLLISNYKVSKPQPD